METDLRTIRRRRSRGGASPLPALAALVLALLAAGCATLETYIDDAGAYTSGPIKTKNTFARHGLSLSNGNSYSLEGYTLVYGGRETSSWSVGLGATTGGRETFVRYYTFRGGAAERPVEIIRERTVVTLGTSSTFTSEDKWAIAITGDAGMRVEYPLHRGSSETFVTCVGAGGTVAFQQYLSRNKNDLDAPYLYPTGFRVVLNGSDYGILAFYPPALYRTGDLTEELALFVLAASAAYFEDP